MSSFPNQSPDGTSTRRSGPGSGRGPSAGPEIIRPVPAPVPAQASPADWDPDEDAELEVELEFDDDDDEYDEIPDQEPRSSLPSVPAVLVSGHVALDDPLQSLDTLNLLGLSDLLRRVRRTRQVIVSTHDERLASLLERKLRPVAPNERTIRIDLRGWTSEGPSIDQRDLLRDLAGLRLVASA